MNINSLRHTRDNHLSVCELMTNTPKSFLELSLSRGVVVPAIKIGLVVGTVLALINHSSELLEMHFSMGLVGQLILTYLVPYCVSTYSSVKAIQSHAQSGCILTCAEKSAVFFVSSQAYLRPDCDRKLATPHSRPDTTHRLSAALLADQQRAPAHRFQDCQWPCRQTRSCPTSC